MDWFLYDNGLRHERANITNEIWKRSLTVEIISATIHESNAFVYNSEQIFSCWVTDIVWVPFLLTLIRVSRFSQYFYYRL